MTENLPWSRRWSNRSSDASLFDLSPLAQNFGRAMQDLFQSLAGNGANQRKINVSENESEVRVTAELPTGFDQKDLALSLTDDAISIRCEHSETEQRSGSGLSKLFMEKSRIFEQSIPLPAGVHGDKVEAKFDNGVLTIIVPKMEAALLQDSTTDRVTSGT